MPTPEEIKIIICGGRAAEPIKTLCDLADEIATKPALWAKAVNFLEQVAGRGSALVEQLLPPNKTDDA